MMITGWRYRILSSAGVVALVISSLFIANQQVVQEIFTSTVPLINRLRPRLMRGNSFQTALLLSVIFIIGSLWPLFKPQPHRILDLIVATQKRIFIGGLGLATLGYFEWSHRLPRVTLILLVGGLMTFVPLWFITIRHRPSTGRERMLVVGDDRSQIREIISAADTPVVGYLSPPLSGLHTADANPNNTDVESATSDIAAADGGADLSEALRLSGLSQLESVLADHDVTTVCLAFSTADRYDFFGTLDTCYQYGVDVKVHREYSDDVLTASSDVETLVDVDLEPWDPQDYLLKRLFDVVFAGVGLLILLPVIIIIAVAIKLDSKGPILYTQDRTAGFGDTFSVYKFRSMIPESASADPIEDENNDRITRVGAFLRKTHLDEIPQLWSILIGDMSVVGPRAAWTDEEELLETKTDSWRKRWFVKPGLTGLAQINDAKSTDPEAKLRYDISYIREQSFWKDLMIVIRQLWMVGIDVVDICKRKYQSYKIS